MENLLTAQPAQLPDWAATALNLADPRLGAEAVACSDDFFAPMARMLQATPPIFAVGRYDDHGKWMDGWESRRKRGPGHDWAVVRLGRPGAIAGFEVDTSFFTGNFPPACAIDACVSPDPVPGAATVWETLLPPTPLAGDSHQFFSLNGRGGDRAWTHVRLNILPDGGVARLRVYGRPVPAWQALPAGTEVDLLAAENGGRAVAWNDAHFGAAANLILPGRGVNMGDGWETRRRREPGHDWCILALGAPGTVSRIEVDTAHFKGNFPDRVSLQAVCLDGAADQALPTQSLWWPTLLPEQPLTADALHSFTAEVAALGPITHVRLNLHPDGGVSRLRLWGRPALEGGRG